MRTIDDIKATVVRYRRELAEEQKKTNSHYVVIGGNMCITQKGSSRHYVLGKGDPVPMVLDTARKHFKKNESKMMDGIKLEVVKYSKWLEDSINECEKLLMYSTPLIDNEPVSQPVTEEVPEPLNVPVPVVNDSKTGDIRPIHITCPTCPMEFGNCSLCKLCISVNTNDIPWSVECKAKE